MENDESLSNLHHEASLTITGKPVYKVIQKEKEKTKVENKRYYFKLIYQ